MIRVNIRVPDLSVIMDILHEQSTLVEGGKAIIAQMGRRIRQGAGGVSYDGLPLEPNSPDYQAVKEGEGYSPYPLVRTGRMTEPTAWLVSASGDMITLSLQQEHHAKLHNIMEIATKKGRKGWLNAWGIGEQERKAFIIYVMQTVNRKLNQLFG